MINNQGRCKGGEVFDMEHLPMHVDPLSLKNSAANIASRHRSNGFTKARQGKRKQGGPYQDEEDELRPDD